MPIFNYVNKYAPGIFDVDATIVILVLSVTLLNELSPPLSFNSGPYSKYFHISPQNIPLIF